jgi:hypothetical protein
VSKRELFILIHPVVELIDVFVMARCFSVGFLLPFSIREGNRSEETAE